MSETERTLLGSECKHVIYGRATDGSQDDILFVKVREHYSDGTNEPGIRLVKNYKRKFGVTREGNRDHKQKKEWEKISKLQMVETTQREMSKKVMRYLGMGNGNMGMKQIARNPYIYGTDISTSALFKAQLMKRFPDLKSDSTVAAFDVETMMVAKGNIAKDEVIIASVTFKDRIHLVIRKEFVQQIADPEKAVREAFQKYLSDLPVTEEWREKNPGKEKLDLIKERNLKLQLTFVETSGQVVAACIATLHEWKPDFVVAWNMKFDLEKTIQALERENYNLADVFSDPDVPARFRFFDIRWGQAFKVTADGDRQSLSGEEQWHSLIAPTSFYWIDSMATYHRLRMAGGKQQSLKLNSILQKHLGLRKLGFSFADHVSDGPGWHIFMQEKFPIEYSIYNIFDDVGLEMLDEVTTDVSRLISAQCMHSEYRHFASQTRRTWDDFHFFCEERGMLEAATSDQMEDELDKHVVGLDGWIATLPSHLVIEEDGLDLIEELPGHRTLVRTDVADLDVRATYPTLEMVCNISKETTSKELGAIDGVTELDRRAAGVNMSGGSTNAIELCVSLYKAPTPNQLLASFMAEIATKEPGAAVEEVYKACLLIP
jgi:hypothetical protein